jgi:putative ABC transport system permease protein
VGLTSTDLTDDMVSRLRAALPAKSFEVRSWMELSDFYRKAVSLLSRQAYGLAALIGVTIVLGIGNTLTMNVLERTREIGTAMALGATRARILRLFVLEGSLLGLLGGATGLAVGWALAVLLSHVGIPMPPPPGRNESYSAEIILTPAIAGLAFAIAVAASIVASCYPAWKASRLAIVDALRHNR